MDQSEKQGMNQPIEGSCAGGLRNGVDESRSAVVSNVLRILPTSLHLILLPFTCMITLYLCTLEIASAQGVSINVAGTPPDASAGLDVNFSDKGLLIPRMNTAARDAIASPAYGLQILNTTDNCLQIYNGVQSQRENMYCFVGCPAHRPHRGSSRVMLRCAKTPQA